MSKDPAFLFYSSDFLTGTAFFSDEQTGKYIRLLCMQHQTGHLNYEDMIKICKTHDKHIFSKFVQDSDGLYFNERLDVEHNKRKNYCESRGKNRANKKELKPSYDIHMENENENSIVTNTLHSGEKSDLSRNMGFGKRFSESHTQIDHALKTFKNNGLSAKKENVLHLLRQFVSEIESKAQTKQSYTEFSSHFISWAKMNKQLQLPSTHVRQ